MSFEQWRKDLETRWQLFKASVDDLISSTESTVEIRDESVIQSVFSSSEGGAPNLACPVCGFFCTHVISAHVRTGSDEGGKGCRGVERRGESGDRRDALCVGVEGECGHKFNIVFQQHKGVELIQIEIAARDREAADAFGHCVALENLLRRRFGSFKKHEDVSKELRECGVRAVYEVEGASAIQAISIPNGTYRFAEKDDSIIHSDFVARDINDANEWLELRQSIKDTEAQARCQKNAEERKRKRVLKS